MLEAYVGHKLFIRKSKGVEATENAIFLNNLIIESLDTLEEVESMYSRKVKREEKLHVLGISEHLYKSMLADKLSHFKHLSIRFEEKSDVLFDLVNQQEIDAAIVHQEVQTFDVLTRKVMSSPLVLVAHSLGAHILSNYIYDATEKPPYINGFAGFETLSSFITFGTNIPVFLMSIAEDDLCPIAPKVAKDWQDGDPPWWLNHYDLHDPLAYPLEMLGGKYTQMVADGAMAERTVRSGPQIPVYRLYRSHSAYWRNRTIVQTIADRVQTCIDC